MRARTYDPLGYCMYCLGISERLSEEHIIPYSLNGAMKLPMSVCPDCQRTTGKQENRALDADFLVPRLLLGLARRRSKKKAPKLLPAVYLGDGMNAPSEEFQVQLERGTFPPIFWLPRFEIADLYRDLPAGGDITSIRMQVCNLNIPTNAPPEVTLLTKADPFAIAYSIAKWAYAFAAAERVTERCDTRGIRSMLLGKADDVKNYVGGAIVQERARRGHLHRLELRQRGKWQTVVLNLFASAGLSPYEVVIGQIP